MPKKILPHTLRDELGMVEFALERLKARDGLKAVRTAIDVVDAAEDFVRCLDETPDLSLSAEARVALDHLRECFDNLKR